MATGAQTDLTLNTKVTGNKESAKKLGTITKKFKEMRTAANLAGGALLAAGGLLGVKAIKAASAFESRMANINTLLNKSTKEMRAFGKEVLKVAGKVPVEESVLSAALYDIVSAGITDTADAMLILEDAAKLGVAGLGSAGEAADLMTSAMNSFGIQAEDSNKVADIFFKTVKAGKNTIADLAVSFGNLGPLAAATGVSLEEIQAATAAITVTGKSASEAQTGLSAAIGALIKPSGDMLKVFDELNVKTGQELIQSQGGLVNALGAVRQATLDLDILESKAIGRKEALVTSIALLGEQNTAFTQILADMNEGQNQVNKAFEIQSQTAAAAHQQLKNNLSVIMVQIGSEILPPLVELTRKFSDWLNKTDESGRTVAETFKTDVVNSFKAIADIVTFVIEKWKNLIFFFDEGLKKLDEFTGKVKKFQLGMSLGDLEDFQRKFPAPNVNTAKRAAARAPAQNTVRFANGGDISAGQTGIVGDGGEPELFTPKVAGTITPLSQLGGNITVNVSGVFGSDAAEEVGDMIVQKLINHVAV